MGAGTAVGEGVAVGVGVGVAEGAEGTVGEGVAVGVGVGELQLTSTTTRPARRLKRIMSVIEFDSYNTGYSTTSCLLMVVR